MYKSKFAQKDIDELYEAVLTLETVEECYRFFEDLCTVKEIFDMAQRWKVAKMLEQKKPYHDIVDETSASTATISRVSKCLTYGAEGYQLVINKQKKSDR